MKKEIFVRIVEVMWVYQNLVKDEVVKLPEKTPLAGLNFLSTCLSETLFTINFRKAFNQTIVQDIENFSQPVKLTNDLELQSKVLISVVYKPWNF